MIGEKVFLISRMSDMIYPKDQGKMKSDFFALN